MVWMSYPEIGLTQVLEIQISKKMDEFSRNWSSSCPGNFPIRVKLLGLNFDKNIELNQNMTP